MTPFLIVLKCCLMICQTNTPKILKIKDMSIFPQTVERHITNMPIDVTEQQTVALKGANVFSIVLDESIVINDSQHLALVVR